MGDSYRQQLMLSSQALMEKWLIYERKHDKVILLYDNARLHVAKSEKSYLETLKREALLQPPYSPDIASTDYH
ncbi:mariner Mos1 transposase [Trichonephila clavipes]|nr:mariner Mos1 transposase [Trichonephila clavipes]